MCWAARSPLASARLPQPLETELAAALAAVGREDALAKLYPGDELDSATDTIHCDPRATHRGFDDADRAASTP